MKKYLNIILAIAASVLVFSCKQDQPDGSQYAETPALEIVSKDVVFYSYGGNGSIVVNTRDKVYASSERPWLSAEVSGSTVYLTAEANETLESRYATVTIVSGEQSATVTAQQFGRASDLIWEDTYTVDYNEGSLELPFAESGFIRISVPEGKEWLSADTDGNALIISFGANPYKAEREGSVLFSVGGKERTVGILQEGNPSGLNPGDPEPREFTVQEAWTPKYVGISPDDETKAIVGVDAAEGSSAGRYFIKVVPAAEYDAVGSQYTFLNLNAIKWAAENPEICKESDTVLIDALSYGDYLIYAIGVNNRGEVNYTYAVERATVTKELSPYEKFLGTWAFPRGDGEDTWTVTEKVPNQSYTITGIDAKTDLKVEALFNSADGTISVRTQTDLGESTVNTSSGQLTGQAQLLGKVTANDKVYRINGNYTIFTVHISSDASQASLVPGTVNITSLGGELTLIGFAIYTFVGESAYSLTQGSVLPNTITHLTQGSGSGGSGGGGNGGGGDNSGYNAWIGTWNAGGGRTLKVSQATAGSTYTVLDSGYTYEDFAYETTYDSTTGNMLFHTQLVLTEGVDEYYLIGIEGNSLRYGDESKDYLIATGSISGNSATITGTSYSTTSGNASVASITILDYQTEDTDDYDAGWYGLSSIEDLDLPVTLTKASTSAVNEYSKSESFIDLGSGKIVKTASRKALTKKRIK